VGKTNPVDHAVVSDAGALEDHEKQQLKDNFFHFVLSLRRGTLEKFFQRLCAAREFGFSGVGDLCDLGSLTRCSP
jgi:hypothetical protein